MHIKKLIGQGYTGPMDPEGIQQKHVSDTPPPPPLPKNQIKGKKTFSNLDGSYHNKPTLSITFSKQNIRGLLDTIV